MKVYHVTVEYDDGTDTPCEHCDLGLYTTWKAARKTMIGGKYDDYTVHHCLDGLDGEYRDPDYYAWKEGKVWVNEEGQATRMRLYHPTTRTQWFIVQREVKA